MGIVLSIILLSSSFMYLINLNPNLDDIFSDQSNANQDHELNDDFGLMLSDSLLFEYSGVGKAQNVTEYGEGNFLNNNINVSNNENATVIIPDEWKAEQLQVDITELFEYDKKWINDSFDSGYDSNYWSNFTNRPQNVTFGLYDAPSGTNDSIYIRFEDANEGGTPWNGVVSYWNYTFSLPREQIPFEDWIISFNYRVLYNDSDWLTGIGGASNRFDISVNGQTQSFAQTKLNLLENNTWYQDSVVPFKGEQYNFMLPGTINLIFGINFGNSGINPPGFFEIYYDNITLQLSTLPNPSQIGLNITDLTNGQDKAINDADDPIIGTVELYNIWTGATGGTTHHFSFNHNSSAIIILSSVFLSKTISSQKTETSLRLVGSDFSVENSSSTIWTYYFPLSIPGSYSEGYYFNISKPLNWNVTQVIDPYSNNKINEVIGAGVGNSTLTIPNDIITEGVWEIVAEAPNYVELAKLFRKDGSLWSENDTFYVGDELKINATIKTLIPHIENTLGTLKIFSPNGSLWYQEGDVSVDINGKVEFSKITLGISNASTGKYSAQIIWHDNNVNMSHVGFSLLQFNVIHKTNLTAINSYFELIAGNPLLLKVKFTDSDLNASIDSAIVIYNSTFGSSGTMVYQGFGEYSSEIDTSTLGLGDYYFSFNASKSYFENQTAINLIHLKIIAQPLALELPHTAISAMANDYAICQINVTGAISGTLIIDGANITTDWENPYSILDLSNGTFELNFSTNDIPTQGIIESFTITIFANKTDYGATTGFITLIVNPIQTVADSNESIVNAHLNEVIDLKVNYTIEGSNELISGATCSVDWQGASNIVPVADGFILSLDTKDFSINSYNVLIKLEHVGYTNAFISITIIISEQSVNLNVAINSLGVDENSIVETSYNEVITLSCRAYAALEQIYLSGGTITFINEQYEQSLVKYDNSWFTTSIPISTSTFSLGVNYVYIKFQQDNYTTTTFSFQIIVNQIEFDVQTIDFQDSIGVNPGEKIQIRINLTEFRAMNFIENATISYSWDFGLGNFEEIGDGIYELELVVPENIRGNHKIILIISKEGSVYKTTQYSFLLVINEPEFPVFIIWIIIIISAAIISVLGILSLRAYVFLPKKKKRNLELQQRIQLFKDVWNIQAFLVIHKKSGLPIYNKSISIFKNQDSTIISGFIQAISVFSESLVDQDTLVTKKIDAQDKYLKKVFELDFKYFYLLVCEYEAIRTILIIKERSSNRLRKQLYLLAVAIYAQFPEKLENFVGLLTEVKDGIDVLLNQFLFLYYYEPFSLTNKKSYFSKIMNSGDLTKMETRIINVILSEFRSQKLFRLNILVGLIDEENRDLVLDGIRSLIKRKILVSPYLNKFSSTINKNFK